VEFDKLKAFYTVAQEKSISAGAAKLNLAQSALSRKIGLLENELKSPLFLRTPKGVSLTEAGEVLFETAQQILSLTEMAKIQIADYKKEPQGTLKIVTTMGAVNVWLMAYMAGFLERYPKMRVIIVGNDQDLDLKSQHADVAIRPYVPDRPDLVQQYLRSYHLRLYASQQYLKKHGTPIVPQDLDHHKLITFSTDNPSSLGDVDWLLQLGAKQGHSRKPYMQVNSALALQKAAEDGIGIVSLGAENPGVASNLVEVLPNLQGKVAKLYYVYPERLKYSKRITALGNYLVDKIGDNLP
jgi:DNA-binding transcriptional LysR family regulator